MASRARQRILDAAARLLRERGISRLTTREIARAADAAEGSITKNFGGKLGLLIALLSRELPETKAWHEALTPQGERPMRSVLIDLIDRGIDYYAASLPLVAGAAADRELFDEYRSVNRDNGTGPHLPVNLIAAYLAECQESGLLPGGDPYAMALALCGAAQLQAYTEFIGDPKTLKGSRAERVSAVADLLLAR